MMNYKDKTIAKLCTMINYLDACGCMTDEQWEAVEKWKERWL